MGQKSEEKRQFILKQAREVFAKKGYRAVTMKDIVDACGISRGGLYLYFKSTKEIFLALLKQEEEKAQNRFAEAVRDRTSSAEILVWYLSQQVEALFSEEDGLAAAGYEYAFSGGDVSDQTARLDASIRSLEYLLKVGSRRGELVCTDPQCAFYPTQEASGGRMPSMISPICCSACRFRRGQLLTGNRNGT